MRQTNDRSAPAAISAARHASVDPAKYYDLAIAHVRANGGEGVVVTERGTPAEWRAWLAYFAFLDGQTFPPGGKARVFRSMRNGATVPTAWPIEFDLSAPPSPPPEPERPVSPGRRGELAAMLRAAVAGLAAPGSQSAGPRAPSFAQPRSPDEAEASRAYHAARLAELTRTPLPPEPDFVRRAMAPRRDETPS